MLEDHQPSYVCFRACMRKEKARALGPRFAKFEVTFEYVVPRLYLVKRGCWMQLTVAARDEIDMMDIAEGVMKLSQSILI